MEEAGVNRDLFEFLSILETFPTSIAEAMGNGWEAGDVKRVVAEMRLLADIPYVPHPEPSYGARDPSELP